MFKNQCNEGQNPSSPMIDQGTKPAVINIKEATKINKNFRTTLWTGDFLQLTVMCINPGNEIGAEMHSNVDQFIRVEQGMASVMFGCSEYTLTQKACIDSEYAIIIPAGVWHNIVNTGDIPLKVYSIYAPIQLPYNTIHITKADALKAEHDH